METLIIIGRDHSPRGKRASSSCPVHRQIYRNPISRRLRDASGEQGDNDDYDHDELQSTPEKSEDTG